MLDLVKHDLHPAATIFVPLPNSSLHHFVAKVSARGIEFELLKLARVFLSNAVGMKLEVSDRSPMDLGRLRTRRVKKELDGKGSMKANRSIQIRYERVLYKKEKGPLSCRQLSN